MPISERQPHELLLSLMDSGVLEDAVWQEMEKVRHAPDGFFAKNFASYGEEEAEKRLSEIFRDDHVVASAVELVASGMLELALADQTLAQDAEEEGKEPHKPMVEVIHIDQSVRLPELHSSYEGGALVLANNPYVPGCNCSQPEGAGVFGRGGTLGLRSIGLAVDERNNNPRILLVLPDPNFRTSDSKETHNGFSVVSFTPAGRLYSSSVRYFLYSGALEFALGRVKAERMIGGSNVSSGVQVALDFPGSNEYFVNNIANLGPYLERAAAHLTGAHE